MSELPTGVQAEAERLTLRARRAVDSDRADAVRAERDALLDEHGYRARVREEDRRAVLVCYPADWMDGDTVRFDRIEDRDRAVEIPLGGVGEADAWADVEADNAALVEEVAATAGPVHAANARAFADFMGNHYVRRMATAGEAEIVEFLAEYYPRNAWPTDAERDVVRESLRLVFEHADAEAPPPLS